MLSTAEALDERVPGDLIASSKGRPWRDVLAQVFARRAVQESLIIPAVPEPLIVWVVSGAARVEERELDGEWIANDVRKGDFFLTTSPQPCELRWTTHRATAFTRPRSRASAPSACASRAPRWCMRRIGLRCVIAQGAKRVMLRNEVYAYDASRFLIFSVDLPISAQVTAATPHAPYLCFRLDLDPREIAALLLKSGLPIAAQRDSSRGLYLSRTSDAMLDAVIRLMRLLDTPADAAALAPLAVQEILHRLLKSDEGELLARIGRSDSHAHRTARVITWLKIHFAEPLRIEHLAGEAHMSVSSLHHHFKAVTAMSPLQYQKQLRLRLQEARRLLLSEAVDAATAGHRMGYESPSQFSREYSRLFGAPPSRDFQRLRQGGIVASSSA